MSEGYYRDPLFCLECAFQHARDVEHHLEDWHKFTEDEIQRKVSSDLRDRQRKIRKEIDEWRMIILQSYGGGKGVESSSTAQSYSSPTLKEEKGISFHSERGQQNPSPEIPPECRFEVEKVKPKEFFDPRSFRTLCPECPQKRCALCPPELACATRIIIGCPSGQWDEEVKRCKVGTETHVIYHGKPKP